MTIFDFKQQLVLVTIHHQFLKSTNHPKLFGVIFLLLRGFSEFI